jgi:GntP family gluconate:H+ symporter
MAFLVLALSILFIIVAIVVLDLHPFLALVLAAVLVGLCSPRPLMDMELERAERELGHELSSEERAHVLSGKQLPEPVLALELTAEGFGRTAASIGIVIVLAAIIGQCLIGSGAADRIVGALLALFGERRAGLSLMGSGYLLSIPVFFDTVFFLLVPLARSLRQRTGSHYVLYVMAMSAGAVITHSLVPPTPGPLVMAETLGLDLGAAILGGLALSLVPAAVVLIASHRVDAKLEVPDRGAPLPAREEGALPGLFVSLLPVVLPVVLISGHSIVAALGRADWTPWTAFFGNKNFALLVASFIAAVVFKRQRNLTLRELSQALEPAITSAGVIILITSAGGAFGGMLSRIGIDASLREWSVGGGGSTYLLIAFAIASVMKIAQGSGTVSMITTAGVMTAILPESLPFHLIYVYAAIGFGSLVLSWMNDSGFWVVCKMSGFTETETLRTWTFALVVIGLVGLVQVLVLSAVWPLV